MPYEQLNKERILAALRRLGELALAEGTQLEIALYGGAVFTLVYESRATTKDVDAIARPSDLAKRLVAQVASEQKLVDEWLNDDVKMFLAGVGALRPLDTLALGEGIRISVPTAAYLLALKLRSCRRPLAGVAGDYEDIRFLLKKMNITSVAEAEAVFERFFPEDAMLTTTAETVRNLLKEISETRAVKSK
ncbi:MAG: hypothetical protein LBR07_07825 [Puniceicoccales bacterium]|jgi:hypothetical protein|nr:hypothetical protein [Puniceicoccales bacterium]